MIQEKFMFSIPAPALIGATLLLWASQCQLTTVRPPATSPKIPQDSSLVICADGLSDAVSSDTAIPADLFAPPNRNDICGWHMPEDTTTPAGNFVQYRISNDSCCRNFLYLRWGNKHLQNTANLGQLRQFRPRMTPEFVHESDEYLFLTGAGNGSSPPDGSKNLWLFPLQPNDSFAVVHNLGWDRKSMTIIRYAEPYGAESPGLEAYNLRTKRIKKIDFGRRSRSVFPLSSDIDSLSITPATIFMKIWTTDAKGEALLKTIVLKNDIK
jgi:hypothetical protein